MKAVARESGYLNKYDDSVFFICFGSFLFALRKKKKTIFKKQIFFKKMERLRTLLADRDFKKGGTFLEFEPLPFLLDPELLIKCIILSSPPETVPVLPSEEVPQDGHEARRWVPIHRSIHPQHHALFFTLTTTTTKHFHQLFPQSGTLFLLLLLLLLLLGRQ